MFNNHVREAHIGETTNYYLEFDWVVLKPGGGHFKMNAIKSFVKLNWIPLFSKLADILGFQGDKAKYIARACRDHHKAWQMILINGIFGKNL